MIPRNEVSERVVDRLYGKRLTVTDRIFRFALGLYPYVFGALMGAWAVGISRAVLWPILGCVIGQLVQEIRKGDRP